VLQHTQFVSTPVVCLKLIAIWFNIPNYKIRSFVILLQIMKFKNQANVKKTVNFTLLQCNYTNQLD